MKQLLNKTLSAFLQGLIYLAPISITIFIIYKGFVFIDSLLPFNIPGLGIIVIFTGITVVGFLGSFMITRPIRFFLKKLLEKVPIFKIVFTSISDLLNAFVGQKRKFTEPVMVKMNEQADVYKLGFITETDLTKICIDNDKVAVYLPHSYNFSGNLFIVPRRNITPIDAPPAEVMKFIVSGGVTKV